MPIKNSFDTDLILLIRGKSLLLKARSLNLWLGILFIGLGIGMEPGLDSGLGVSSFVSAATITPGHVLARVHGVQAHLEQLRAHLSAAKNTQPPMGIEGASPRDVFFQMVTLVSRSQLLRKEQTGQVGDLYPLRPKKITPGHVIEAVIAADEHLIATLKELGLSPAPVNGEGITGGTPTDVIIASIQAARQIDLLVQRPIVPADVLQVVLRSQQRAAVLLTRAQAEHNTQTMIPARAPLITGTKPAAVYDELVRSAPLLEKLLKVRGLKAMHLTSAVKSTSMTKPGDVVALATTLFVGSRALFNQLPNPPILSGVYYPGPATPAHVLQIAQQLRATLKAIHTTLQ